MMKQKELVPKKRFAGFTEKWNLKKMEELASFSKGKGYSKRDLVSFGNPIILYGHLYTDYKSYIQTVKTYATKKENSVISQGNEVIVPSSGETAEDIARASAVGISGVILAGDLNIIKPNPMIDSLFLGLNISNSNLQRELIKRVQGSSVVHLYNSDIEEVNLSYPTLKEQQKIGQFFKHLDEMIILEQRKIDKTKALKSAYLAEMFPAEGEQVPKRRFAGFTRNWEQCKLGNIATFRQGVQVGLERQHMKKTSNNIRFIRIVDYTQQTKDIRYIDFNNNLNLVNEEDIVMVRYGAVGFVGRGIRGVIANNMFTVNPEVVLDKDYLFTFLKRDKINELLNKNTGSSTMPALNFSVISDLELAFPEIEEQKKIGKLFKQFDDIITNHQHKLDKLKATKQAYLNEMFV